ncbi:MAG: ABC transporter substrate-binding protein [Patescibacteria group bacterium]
MLRKLRFYSRLLTAFVTKYYHGIVTGMLVGAVFFIFSPKIYSLIVKFRSSSRIAVVGRYTLTDIPIYIQKQISGGLTRVDESGQAIPHLAESWQATDEGKTYFFKIRSDIKWQDGKDIISRDLNYKFTDAQFEYPDDHTLKIVLADPYAALPVSLARPVFKKSLLGWGEHRVTSIKRNGLLLDTLSLDPRIVYRFYNSENLAKMAFKLGLVDVLEEITKLNEIEQWPNVNISEKIHFDRYLGVFFNTTKLDKNMRQALSYAIDKNRWPNRALGPINPKSWAYNPDIKPYDYDSAKASQMLSKLEKKPDTLTLSTLPVYSDIAESVKQDWEKAGIKVNVEIVNSIPENFTAMILTQVTPPDPDQYNLWHSTQGTNNTHLDNKRIDKLLEEGRKTVDPKLRLEIYRDFQKFLLEEAPVAFLYYQTTYTVTRK